MTKRDTHLLAIFIAGPVLLFFYPFLKGQAFYIGDILYSFQPWLTYAAQIIQSGQFPFWDPYTAAGQPLYANPQTMLYYPIAQFLWMFPFTTGFKIYLALSQTMLFTSTYLLIKRWMPLTPRGAVVLASIAFTWGGFTVIHWEFPSAAGTLWLIPLLLLFTLTRQWLLIALVTALLCFSGYPQFSVYAVMLAGLAVIVHTLKSVKAHFRSAQTDGQGQTLLLQQFRLPLYWLLAVSAGLLIGLIQILPTWEFTSQSTRTQISSAETLAYMLNPYFLIKFLIPDIFNKIALAYSTPAFGADLWPVQRNWLNTYFIGTTPFILALIGVTEVKKTQVKFLVFVAFFACAMAMGLEPLLTVVRKIIPGFQHMTHFSNFMLLTVMAFILLSAQGWQRTDRQPFAFCAVTLIMLIPCVLLSAVPDLRTMLLNKLLDIQTLTHAQHRWVIAAACQSAAALIAVLGAVLLTKRTRLLVLIILTIVQLWFFGSNMHPLTNTDFFHRPVFLSKHLQNTPHRYAIDPENIKKNNPMSGDTLSQGMQSIRQALYPNIHLPFRIHAAWGYEVFPLKKFTSFKRNIPDKFFTSPSLQFLGGHHILTMRPLTPPAKLMAKSPFALLYTNPEALPRVTWVPEAVIKIDPKKRLQYINTDWDPASQVILEEKTHMNSGRTVPGSQQAEKNIKWKEEPGELIATGHTGKGWLVYSQTHYPGWQAYINGKETKIYLANHAFQAIPTPDGAWKAYFVYR